MLSNDLIDPEQNQMADASKTNIMSDFLGLVRTRKDSEVLLGEIDGVLETQYKVKPEALEEFLRDKVRANSADLFRTAKESETNFLGFLKSLRQILLDLKEVQLTVAFEPTEDIIDEIFQWLKSNLNTSIIINFVYDPAIIGGAQVAFRGNFSEYSLRKILEQELDEFSGRNI